MKILPGIIKTKSHYANTEYVIQIVKNQTFMNFCAIFNNSMCNIYR